MWKIIELVETVTGLRLNDAMLGAHCWMHAFDADRDLAVLFVGVQRSTFKVQDPFAFYIES